MKGNKLDIIKFNFITRCVKFTTSGQLKDDENESTSYITVNTVHRLTWIELGLGPRKTFLE